MDVLLCGLFSFPFGKILGVRKPILADAGAVLVLAHPLIVWDADELERTVREERPLNAAAPVERFVMQPQLLRVGQKGTSSSGGDSCGGSVFNFSLSVFWNNHAMPRSVGRYAVYASM